MKKRIFSFLLAVLMLAALLPTAAFADESTRKAVPVTGGNIYVDMEKGEVVDCDDTVTEMIVPEQVDGVTIQAISDRAFQERILISAGKSLNITNMHFCSSVLSRGTRLRSRCSDSA